MTGGTIAVSSGLSASSPFIASAVTAFMPLPKETIYAIARRAGTAMRGCAFSLLAGFSVALGAPGAQAAAPVPKPSPPGPVAPAPETAVVDVRAQTTPFPHFWEQMFGSGRAILSLRASYQDDLQAVKTVTGVQWVRFHDILDDDIGFVSADAKGNLFYNFTEVDEIYDALVARGVRPYVELSFMPRAIASSAGRHAFWYPFLPNPPKDYRQWGAVVGTLARHLVGRYGLAEVNQWYFEVWNEPNLDFWTGKPAQSTYFQLYDAAAHAIKAEHPSLRVGGPATAQAAWIPEFIRHCVEGKVPVDFVSTHVYGDDAPAALGPGSTGADQKDFVSLAVRRVHDQVVHSPLPHLPIIWSEYNATYRNIPAVTDSAYMGPWLGHTISACDGLTTLMSYWDFSDVFDEQGVRGRPFYGGYGIIAGGHIPKPAFNAFALFHRLGTERLPVHAPWILATRKPGGALALAVWHYAGAQVSTGPDQTFVVRLTGWTHRAPAKVEYLDDRRGSAMTLWTKLGSPVNPSFDEIKRLRAAAQLPPSTRVALQGDTLTLRLPIHGLALVELD
jgi:xylan 1,4-beta-xylosidase